MKRANALRLCPPLILLALLTACEVVSSSSAVTIPVVVYSKEFQAQAAKELESMKVPCARDVAGEFCSATHRLVIDYRHMRKEARAGAGD